MISGAECERIVNVGQEKSDGWVATCGMMTVRGPSLLSRSGDFHLARLTGTHVEKLLCE